MDQGLDCSNLNNQIGEKTSQFPRRPQDDKHYHLLFGQYKTYKDGSDTLASQLDIDPYFISGCPVAVRYSLYL